MGALLRQSSLFGEAPMVPKHVAFIMDGNRRFAKRKRIATADGHSLGFDKVVGVLEWCLDVGVPCVSVYAFSLENFRRSPSEVDTLMKLFEDRLLTILQEDVVKRHGVRVRVLGDLSRLPPGVAHAARRAMQTTAHHSTCLLNICLAYTSTDEVGRALVAVQKQVSCGTLPLGDITLSHIERHLDTVGCPRVDLVIRTSGETRLSDFLLQQSSAASLHFTSALWPDFSFTNLLTALCQFQREAPLVAALASTAAAAAAAAAAKTPVSSVTAAAPFPGMTLTGSSAAATGIAGGAMGAAPPPGMTLTASPAGSSSGTAERHRTSRSPTADCPVSTGPSSGAVAGPHAIPLKIGSPSEDPHWRSPADRRDCSGSLTQYGKPGHFGERDCSRATCSLELLMQSMTPMQRQYAQQHYQQDCIASTFATA